MSRMHVARNAVVALAAVAACARSSRAGDETAWRPLDPEEISRVLVAEELEHRQCRTPVCLTEVWDQPSPRFHQRWRWMLAGHPSCGAARKELIEEGGWVSSVSVLRDGLLYRVSRSAVGKPWFSVLEKGPPALGDAGVVGRSYGPIPSDGSGWLGSLAHYPIGAARARGAELEVTFVMGEDVLRILRTGERIDYLSGALGYMVCFRRLEGAYRVQRVDHLQRAEYPVWPNGHRVTRRSQQVIERFGRVRILDALECGISIRHDFFDYRRFGDLVLPTRIEQWTWNGKDAKTWIELDSVRVGSVPDDAFRFEPPKDFGPNGVHRDELKDTMETHGSGTIDRDLVVPRLVQAGDEIQKRVGARSPASELAARLGWLTAAVVVAAALAVLWRWRRGQRDPCAVANAP